MTWHKHLTKEEAARIKRLDQNIQIIAEVLTSVRDERRAIFERAYKRHRHATAKAKAKAKAPKLIPYHNGDNHENL